ncbi:hypothetical protein ElyMa_003798700 [Elysia marginata]|uniref:Uncharacterized protein n=1 Tax=Elysia marginata TaxID=1093978 RepID=A0AAV4FD49_9GAST|nr:hypothetical protein ElyMa_003798700 [Elysia marginata]
MHRPGSGCGIPCTGRAYSRTQNCPKRHLLLYEAATTMVVLDHEVTVTAVPKETRIIITIPNATVFTVGVLTAPAGDESRRIVKNEKEEEEEEKEEEEEEEEEKEEEEEEKVEEQKQEEQKEEEQEQEQEEQEQEEQEQEEQEEQEQKEQEQEEQEEK